jgi:hypothetical protein
MMINSKYLMLYFSAFIDCCIDSPSLRTFRKSLRTQDENTDHNSNQLSSVTEGKEEPEKKKKITYKTEDLQKTYKFYFN